MLSRKDAQYVISEIRFRGYYESRAKELSRAIDDIEAQISRISNPVSPNGRVKIGYRPPGNDGRMFQAMEAGINSLITRQMEIEQEMSVFVKRKEKAEKYLSQLLESSEEKLVKDFFCSAKTHRQIEREHHISNAYDRMIRLIQNSVTSL